MALPSALLSSAHPLLLLLGFGSLVIIFVCLKNAFFGPYKNVPGPWHTRITRLVLKYHIMGGRRLHYIHALHLKYGDVVRIAPTEIDVCDPTMYTQIHKVSGGFLKDPWYQSFRIAVEPDLFFMIDPKQHAERRRLFAPLWTNTALHNNWEQAVTDKVKFAVAGIKQEAFTGHADIFKWWTFMTTDLVSQLAFGDSLNMLRLGTRNQYMEDVEIATKVGGLLSEIPGARQILALLRHVPLSSLQYTLDADSRIQSYGEAAIRNAKSGGLAKQNMFSRFVGEQEKEGSTLKDYQVGSEAGSFIVAGSGTTAVSLTYLVWAVLSRPEVQRRLEEEVNSLPADYKDSQVEKLPYTCAVIDETLRLYGAAPGSLPRQPPKGGAMIGNTFCPAGTTVSSQAYSLHRNPKAWHDPESFNPERFIGTDGQYTPAKAAYAPFGAGSRACLGIHLAMMELRHGTAEFFRECRGARLADSMTPEVMEMLNFFLISPRGNRCDITLRP